MNNQLINYYFTPDYLLLQKGYTLNKFFKLQKTHSFFFLLKKYHKSEQPHELFLKTRWHLLHFEIYLLYSNVADKYNFFIAFMIWPPPFYNLAGKAYPMAANVFVCFVWLFVCFFFSVLFFLFLASPPLSHAVSWCPEVHGAQIRNILFKKIHLYCIYKLSKCLFILQILS